MDLESLVNENIESIKIDTSYFENYEDLSVHELMLRDKPRQDAYLNAIMQNKNLFQNKVVIDVGAGTGILSVFCAQAGAAKVFAVEASHLFKIAKQVVEENGFQDIIEVHHIKIEDFNLPAEYNKVDIIISEWMGFYLLHEGMLDSVIYARDKFLKEDGLMIPDSAAIYIAPCSIPSRFSDWENISGVKMTSFANELRLQKSQNPEIINVAPKNLCHSGTTIAWLDLKEITLDDLEEFNFKDIIVTEKNGRYEGLCLWFSCNMISNSDVILSTDPKSPPTHWKQTVIVYPENACKTIELGEPIAINLVIKRKSDNFRRYDLQLSMIDESELEHIVPCTCFRTKCILAKICYESM